MLILGSRLLNCPVMSLQTGGQLGTTIQPLIDPANLRIIAYKVEGPLIATNPSFLSTSDIREFGQIGMIINNSDELVGLDDVIAIKKLYNLRFTLTGLQVVDDQKRKLGRVNDYTVDTTNYTVQQLNVRRGFLKGITDTGLLINRSQIIEINNSAIIVKSATAPTVEPVMQTIRGEFTNPFRTPAPQSNQKTIQ